MNAPDANKVLADSAAQREAPVPPYTVADAIRDAQFYRSRPDIIFDGRKARLVMDTLLSGLELSRCYFNAVQRGQRTFVLVEQDKAAPPAIRAWAEAAETHGCPPEKTNHAYRTAREWDEAELTGNGMPKKWPD